MDYILTIEEVEYRVPQKVAWFVEMLRKELSLFVEVGGIKAETGNSFSSRKFEKKAHINAVDMGLIQSLRLWPADVRIDVMQLTEEEMLEEIAVMREQPRKQLEDLLKEKYFFRATGELVKWDLITDYLPSNLSMRQIKLRNKKGILSAQDTNAMIEFLTGRGSDVMAKERRTKRVE